MGTPLELRSSLAYPRARSKLPSTGCEGVIVKFCGRRLRKRWPMPAKSTTRSVTFWKFWSEARERRNHWREILLCVSGMAHSKVCPKCGLPLAAGAAEGLCPRCLLEQGFAEKGSPVLPDDLP